MEKVLRVVSAFLAIATSVCTAIARQVQNLNTIASFRAVATALVAMMIISVVAMSYFQFKPRNREAATL